MRKNKEPRGRVIRLKKGYNPNSSSVGSQIPMFLAFAAGAGGLAVVLLHALEEAARLLRRRSGENSPDTKEPGE